jgi:hypothetical protein
MKLQEVEWKKERSAEEAVLGAENHSRFAARKYNLLQAPERQSLLLTHMKARR